ncbi:hypothetical protein [Vibrio genomosp. F6]|uniref:MSHA biogenesis protein MshK n=1 Tax=Vibrio genomosp. F6 str. FF-238 TaxID=1191298 RepID=A0A1E5D882_9VIBR|nr:hypothetical protein [Vibrio genomosp. F6]OEE79901.1 MSHA biogenesis protein MshK [Vibrio genomosp. F6 str. FF-238]
MVKSIIVCLMGISLSAFAAQDPTAPLGWMAPADKVVKKKRVRTYRLPTLQSIVCKDEAPCYAILNDQVVTQGNTIHGYRVKQVNAEDVTLQRGSKTWKLELFSLNIKH